jgi:hypothetical protein
MGGTGSVFYHYTSLQFAQDIGCTGQLTPGLSGFVYLTPQAYGAGIDAADELALAGKPIEMGIEIDIKGISVSSPAPIGPLRDSSGALIRKGGGTEVKAKIPVPVGNPTKWISLSKP